MIEKFTPKDGGDNAAGDGLDNLELVTDASIKYNRETGVVNYTEEITGIKDKDPYADENEPPLYI